jgi:membrane-associated phospholipid phosphatase
MAEKYARCIVVLLCLAAVPSRTSAQDAAVSVAQSATEVTAQRNFLETIADGVKSVVSKESVPLLSSAAAFALFALPFDETLTYSASCSTFLKTAFEGWARIGGQEWALAGGSLATLVIGRATDHPKVAALGGDLVQSQIVAGVTTFALKHAIQRTRPDGEPRSFPSGHAAGTFAAATVMQRHYGLKGAIPAYTVAVLISGARLQANSHYATDLISWNPLRPRRHV